MPPKVAAEQKIGQRMVALALELGLVGEEQVRECEEFVQENLFQGSVLLALFHRGHLDPEELKKVIDLCLQQETAGQTTLEQVDRASGHGRDSKSETRRTIIVSKEAIDKLAAEERARRMAESGGSDPVGSQRVIRYHEVIGPYHVVEVLGRGGMGRVVKAYHRDLARMVALKFILPEGQQRIDLLRRFEQEAMLAAKLHHPHIVAIYDVDLRGERPYIAMEYVKGQLLADLIAQRQLTVEDSLRLALKLARALHYAHERDILHRDVKPQNILIDVDGEPRLTDFGLARSIEHGSYFKPDGLREHVMGTPYYMSPETIRGDPRRIGPASDVFSLGAVLFEMLSGELPFDAEEELQVLKQILHYDPIVNLRYKNPAVDADLEAIVLKALEKIPAERYRSAKALADDLENYIKGRPIQARPYSGGQRFWRTIGRHRLLAAGLLLAAALLGWAALYKLRLAKQAAAAGHQDRTLQQSRAATAQRDLAGAEEQRSAGDQCWEQMLLAERAGRAAEARRLLAQASRHYDVADHLYRAVRRADPARKKVLQRRIALLKKRLRWAALADDPAEEERLSRLLRETAESSGAPELVADHGTLSLGSEPSGAAFWVFRLERREGRLVKARLPLLKGKTPATRLALPAGRYLVLLSDPERGLLEDAVLVRAGAHLSLAPRMLNPETLPDGMLHVPGGMTITGGEPDAAGPRPRRTAHVGPLLLSRLEVTSLQYLRYLNDLPQAAERRRRIPRSALDGKPVWPLDGAGRVALPAGHDPSRPVTGISWEDATAHAASLAHKSGRAYRLPTADEWERAARAGDGRRYPWGGGFGSGNCLSAELPDAARMLRAGRIAFDRSVYGVQDLGGSVREWVADWYSKPRGERMVRGGSYLAGRRFSRSASLSGLHQRGVAPDVGFRLACDP